MCAQNFRRLVSGWQSRVCELEAMAHEMFYDLPFLNMVISIPIYIYISCYIRTFSIPPTGQQANPKVHYSQVSNVVDAVSGSVTNCTSDRSTSHVYGWFFMKLPRTTYGWPLLETLLHRDIESLERRVEKSTYGSFFRMLERVSKDILYRTYLLRVFAYLFWGCFLLLVIPIKKSRCIH
jgi:hypothetical protein